MGMGGKIVIPIGTGLTVKVTANSIHVQGVQEIQNLLSANASPPLETGFEWVLQTDRGTISKRIASSLYKGHKFKLPDEVAAKIGEVASKYADRRPEYYIDFTNKIDWKAGDFGDSESCYWRGNTAAKAIHEKNGFAVRFFADDKFSKGIARAWMGEVTKQLGLGDSGKQAFAMWNSYGAVELMTMARVVAGYFELGYKIHGLVNNKKTTGILYMNNSSYSFLLANQDVLDDAAKSMPTIELNWKDPTLCCAACEKAFGAGTDPYTGLDHLRYCESCWAKKYVRCGFCHACFLRDNENAPKDYTVVREEVKVAYRICHKCAMAQLVTCCDCKLPTLKTQIYQLGEEKLCTICYRAEACGCGACGGIGRKKTFKSIDGWLRCGPCAKVLEASKEAVKEKLNRTAKAASYSMDDMIMEYF